MDEQVALNFHDGQPKSNFCHCYNFLQTYWHAYLRDGLLKTVDVDFDAVVVGVVGVVDVVVVAADDGGVVAAAVDVGDVCCVAVVVGGVADKYDVDFEYNSHAVVPVSVASVQILHFDCNIVGDGFEDELVVENENEID